MLRMERLQTILNKAREQSFTTMGELAQMSHMGLVTIRRGLNMLCEQHLPERCYSGTRVSEDTIMKTDYNVKKEYQREEKQRIAQKTVELASGNNTIYPDSGATIGGVVKLLCEDSRHLSVMTNESSIAIILTDSDVDLTILRRTVHKKIKGVIGHAGEEFLKQFHFSKAFLETSPVNYDFEVFSPTPDKAYLRQMVMGLASQIHLVVDSNKFRSRVICLVGCLNEFASVITDKEFNEKEWKKIRELDINVIEVQTAE